MKLTLIAAMAENRVIGSGGGLPWKLPDEMQHFMDVTMGHSVLMGRKTFESMDRPLPKRTNIVITRDTDYRAVGAHVVNTLAEAIELAESRGEKEAFVIGGAQIYALILPLADRMVLTRVHAEIEGDVRFPSFDTSQWRVVSEARHEADERHAYGYTIREYERVSANLA